MSYKTPKHIDNVTFTDRHKAPARQCTQYEPTQGRLYNDEVVSDTKSGPCSCPRLCPCPCSCLVLMLVLMPVLMPALMHVLLHILMG